MGTLAQEILNDSARLYMRLADTSGTSAVDDIGGTSGSYSGGFTLNQSGLIMPSTDGAPLFDGRSGCVTVAERAALDLGDVFTIECWVYLTSYTDPSRNSVTFIDKGANAYIVRISDAQDGTWILRRNGVATCATSTTRIPLSTITHVMATKNGSTTKLYQNGVDVTSTGTNSTMTNTATSLGIAAADIGAGPNGYVSGQVAHVALYATALSAARAAQHYQAGAGRPLAMMI